jgi:hypothetical protein
MMFKGIQWKALYLSMFWTENPGYKVCGFKAGYHEADVERIVLLMDENNACHWVYFGAHSNKEGVWKKWNDCEKDGQYRLKVYVSPQSHGMYPHKKMYLRVFGFASDMCNRCEEEWIPKKEDFCDLYKQTWLSVYPNLDKKGDIGNPAHVEDPGVNSITCFQRFFIALPFVSKKLNDEKVVTILA